jgi:hypothetical protein
MATWQMHRRLVCLIMIYATGVITPADGAFVDPIWG